LSCNLAKELPEFKILKSSSDGFMDKCRSCYDSDYKKAYFIKNYTPKPKKIQYQWPPPTEKECTKCQVTKKVELFVKSNKTKHGIGSVCIECANKLSQIRRDKNSKNEQHIKKSIEYRKEYRENNKERLKKYSGDYYSTHKKEMAKSGKMWRTKNGEYRKARDSAYRKNNKALCNTYVTKRRARLRYALHPDHNKFIEKVYQEMSLRLKDCTGIRFNVDHILPINSGGFHHHGNLQVVPASLNEGKGDRLDFTHPCFIHWTDLPNYLTVNVIE